VKVGDIDLIPVNDGDLHAPKSFWANLDWSTHADLLDAEGRIRMPIGCFVIRTGGRVVLVDAGLGEHDTPWGTGGALPAQLAAAGFTPDDIDLVVCTHLHIDHVGWLVHQGAPFFPNATVRYGHGDWAQFVESADAEPRTVEAMNVLSHEGRLDPIDGDAVALAPGLTALHTPGHTPGHYGLVVSSGEARAYVLGDAVECPLQLDEPDFWAMSDVDPALARRTREALWREVEGTNALVGAAHFPGLEFGRVLAGQGKRWFPVS
jgi:glyoxylase-like metal-dependent hydrolase (beta-lactamase superfamily II)